MELGHGRWEIRDLTVVAVDTELSTFPHIATILKYTRIYCSTKKVPSPRSRFACLALHTPPKKKQQHNLAGSSEATGV
ncbi:MAG: hypothetical protein ACJAQT_003774 [Akkermansiaceae bacterium]|jgi:hypothetical protein